MTYGSDAELLMLDLINAERASVGLPPLEMEMQLNAAAEDHSEWMLQEDVFSHTGEGGSSAGDRMEDAGFVFSGSWSWGENIAWQSERGDPGIEDDVEDLHNSLMSSPGHRANILSANYDYIGIGIEYGEYGSWDAVMVTQNFASTSAPVQLDSGAGGGSGVVEPLVLLGTAGTDILTGDAAGDFLAGFGGSDRLSGEGGNDDVRGGAGNDDLSAGDGMDILRGGTGNDTLSGGADADDLRGNGGADVLSGGSGDDILRAGNHNDRLDGGSGDDVMVGGRDEDVFVFSAGSDIIADFKPGEDVIDLSGVASITGFADLEASHLSAPNGHAVIADGQGNQLTLYGIGADALDAGDFIF